ncbi:MAG: hypothetical protein NE328_09985, partial [Lentisphaeraceae bacterium]|nr:hypothetical protein [Lentisphaeraceae bacterium]
NAPSPAGTVNMPPAGGAPAGTLKINMPASSTESGTIKVSKPNFAESSSAGTLKIKSPVAVDGGASAGGTLKIKSAAATASASGTLKLKSAGGSDEKLKIAGGGDKKGGTLKLKAKSTVGGGTGAVKRHSARDEEVDDVEAFTEVEDPKAKPGIFMTLSSLVALVAVGTIVFKLVENYMKLFTDMAQ